MEKLKNLDRLDVRARKIIHSSRQSKRIFCTSYFSHNPGFKPGLCEKPLVERKKGL